MPRAGRYNPEIWGNPHPNVSLTPYIMYLLILDKSLWISVATSLSSSGTILSNISLLTHNLLFFFLSCLSLHFPTLLFPVIISKISSLYQILVSRSVLSSSRRCVAAPRIRHHNIIIIPRLKTVFKSQMTTAV